MRGFDSHYPLQMQLLTPKFSIIVPTYNSAQTLKRTLDSISNQTADNYKVSVINNGSTDDINEVWNDFIATLNPKETSKFFKYDFENGGLAEARKRGVSLSADCDYFLFCDADDRIKSDLIETLTKNLQKHNDKDISLIRFGFQFVDPKKPFNELPAEKQLQLHEWYDCDMQKEVYTGNEFLQEVVSPDGPQSMFFCTPMYAYKTEHYKDFHQPNIINEDLASMPLQLLSAKNILALNGYTGYEYFRTENSLSTNQDPAKIIKRKQDSVKAIEIGMNEVSNSGLATEQTKQMFLTKWQQSLEKRKQSLADALCLCDVQNLDN